MARFVELLFNRHKGEQATDQPAPADQPAEPQPDPSTQSPAPAEGDRPGFRQRGRMRRRLRYLRKARELAYRDLGGLTFTLYRFGGRREELMAAKLERLAALDRELRALERALGEQQPLTVLRVAGVVACPRCSEIHSAEDRYCPSCGLAASAQSERPLATSPPAEGWPGAAAPPQAEPHQPSPKPAEERPALEQTRPLSELELGGPSQPPSRGGGVEETRILPPEDTASR